MTLTILEMSHNENPETAKNWTKKPNCGTYRNQQEAKPNHSA